MRQIIIVILLLISSVCFGTEKKQPDIDLEKVESFLSRLYSELKCPSYPVFGGNGGKGSNAFACIYSLTYNLEKEGILFAFTANSKNHKQFEGFLDMSRKEREETLLHALGSLAMYTGALPVREGLYVGKIQRTPMTHVYNDEILDANIKIHDFVRDNAVVGIRVIDGDMRYVAFLDLNHDMHYKEGIHASVLDFEARPTSESD
ncbi:hypothetical protein [Kangiella sp.]|uniref:hypothetical protein n=1 Tax=Kangiella sp. TaxID=1920245 RepID=UPI003A94E356